MSSQHIADLTRLIFRIPSEPSYYVHRAQAYLVGFDFDSALRNCEEASKLIIQTTGLESRFLKRRSASILLTWCQILIDEGNYKLAFKYLVTITGSTITTETIWIMLAIACLGMREINQALVFLDQTVMNETINEEIFILRSRLNYSLGKIVESVADLEIAIKLKPDHPALDSMRILIQKQILECSNRASEQIILKDYNLALSFVNLAIKIDAKDVKTHCIRAFVLIQLSRFSEAKTDLDFSLSVCDDDSKLKEIHDLFLKYHSASNIESFNCREFENAVNQIHQYYLSMNMNAKIIPPFPAASPKKLKVIGAKTLRVITSFKDLQITPRK